MPKTLSSADYHAIDEQAARWWFLSQQGFSARDKQQLEAWLFADVCNASAYKKFLLLDDSLNQIPATQQKHFIESVQPKKTFAANFLQWHSNGFFAIFNLAWTQVAIFASIMLIAGFSSYYYLQQPVFIEKIIVAKGQQSNQQLPDGTNIMLDANTEVLVTFYRNHREINLVRGQAFFNVARDSERPFKVVAGQATATVFGTQFSVRYLEEDVTVAVKEGHVRVNSAINHAHNVGFNQHLLSAKPPKKADLLALQAVKVSSIGNIGNILNISSGDVAAWRDGRLVFKNTTLKVAFAEFSRYSDQKILLADEYIENLKVSGSFEYKKLGSFLKALPQVVPVEIILQRDYTIVKRKNI